MMIFATAFLTHRDVSYIMTVPCFKGARYHCLGQLEQPSAQIIINNTVLQPTRTSLAAQPFSSAPLGKILRYIYVYGNEGDSLGTAGRQTCKDFHMG